MRTARCACGQLSVTVDGAPVRAAICHCDDCRRLSGSAFSWNARWADDAVTVSGAARIFERHGDEGSTIANHFCPDCGVTVFYRNSDVAGYTAIRVGCFGRPDGLAPGFSVYDERRPDWIVLPDALERWN